METGAAIETEEKDLPLREDIRLLGRILGDTIREQSGEAVYNTVENIRQNSVRFRRDEDLTARRDLEATLNSLKPKDALQIIRAFGFFSHLANISEDQHHIPRLRVIDEVANGLSYYDHTFLAGLPRFYADLEEELADAGVTLARGLPSFLRLGSWIGGDRDGNPFVTDGVLRAALRAQSGRALNYYLDELHKLGGELSLDSRVVRISDTLAELSAPSPAPSYNPQPRPHRRAITRIYARLAATAPRLDGLEVAQQAIGEASAYRGSDELLADLTIIYRSLVANGSEILANGHLKAVRRAVDVLGCHLAPLHLRQN